MATTTRDLNVTLIFVIGIVSVLLLFVIVEATQAWFRWEVRQEQQVKVIDQPFQDLDTLNTQQSAQLQQYRWIDRDKGLAQVPIQRAMDLVVRDYRQDRAGDNANSGNNANASGSQASPPSRGGDRGATPAAGQ